MSLQIDEATVLRIEQRGEKSVYINVLCPNNGVVDIIKRVSASGKTRLPDIFDDISATLESAKSGQLKFMGDFDTASQRKDIGLSYDRLINASYLAKCTLKNGKNIENISHLSQVLKSALDSINLHNAPYTARLKFMYILARDEGYPIKEDFFTNLSMDEKRVFSFLIRTPISELAEFQDTSKLFAEKLEEWISSNTDIIVFED